MSTKARFKCKAVIDYGSSKEVIANAVISCRENYIDLGDSPEGEIRIVIRNLPAAEMFAPGKYFIAEFTPEGGQG